MHQFRPSYVNQRKQVKFRLVMWSFVMEVVIVIAADDYDWLGCQPYDCINNALQLPST